MAKVAPYHSISPSDPDVYHDHDDCPSGQQIPAHNRRSGTGGYPRSTLREAGRLLRGAGAAEVLGAALTHTEG
jgi:hypothetical protein